MILIGVGLALAWDYSGLRGEAVDLSQPAAAAQQQSATPPKPEPDARLARLLDELDALKKSISELKAGMQQLAAADAALQAGQQELRQRMAAGPASAYWYSDLAALQMRFVVHQKRTVVSSPARAAADATASIRRSESAPLPLRSAQP
jgi:hypothetical protein